MAHARAKPEERRELLRLITEEGMNVSQASERVGRSRQWGQKVWGQAQAAGGAKRQFAPAIPDALTRPLAIHELSEVAKDCLIDFGRWRARYLGRKSSPWQENAANVVAAKLRTLHKEYGVVNCPPGSGKSTLFTHDIPAWMQCRDRSLRSFIGSSTQITATSYVGRLRNTFDRKVPIEAKSEEKRLGLAYDANSALPLDFGVFRPEPSLGAPWSRSQFTVAQLGETLIGEKEASFTAFGKDSGFLGWRVNFIVWDDLVRRQDFIGGDLVMKLELDRAWWDDEAETRLEPGGLLILQGQRLGAEDLYRYNLDKRTFADDEDYFELGEEEEPTEKKYFHVVYKAHYEEHCRASIDPSVHKRTAEPYDPLDPKHSGCLLDPLRLPWRELKGIQNRPLSNYRTVYQQEDVDPSDVLVPKFYIDGGMDKGEVFPGCWDLEREPGIVPEIVRQPRVALSIITADPSPTKFWSVQWWMYVEFPGEEYLMGRRYLLDQVFKPMGATDLLDFDVDAEAWTGLLVEWNDRANQVHLPIDYLIIEANAAQKFIGQYKWFRRWLSNNSIKFKAHTTHANKLDPKQGVSTIRNHYRFGRVRLPGTTTGQVVAKPLYDQVTNYPTYSYDDCVMGHWFMEFQLQHIVKRAKRLQSVFNDIPKWLNREPTYA